VNPAGLQAAVIMHPEPWTLTASALTQAFRSGALSPVAALRSVLARLDAVNPVINAVVALDIERAQDAALQSERRWRAGQPLSALDGVPFTVKDNIPTAGLRSTFGSRLYADHIPMQDELPVARMRAAGAVLIGKTNVPEFAVHGYTANAVFGVTRNPWQPALTPGGSSGGAVAAVAAGIAPLAIATDGGGSIRRPCAHTGVAGLKPSLGRVARTDGFPAFLHDFEVIGPIARCVADLECAMEIIGAPHAADARSQPFAGQPFRRMGTANPVRILALPALGDAPVDSDTRAALRHAAQIFAGLGHEVSTPDTGLLAELSGLIDAINTEAWPAISQAGLAWFIGAHFAGRESALTPPVAELLALGKARPASDYAQALHSIARLRDRLALLFETTDCLLLPSAAAQPWTAEETHPTAIDGRPAGPRGHAVFTAFVNAAGLPAIALPMGLSAAGLPTGLQLVGRFGADAALCTIGRQFEQAAPWLQLAPIDSFFRESGEFAVPHLAGTQSA
jgi:aspartyl-tRNA(Asn)/glutamyl-tRNA(Gln) amidotransferase subunit A